MEAIGVVKDVSNYLQVIAIMVICAFAALIVWINKRTAESKELVIAKEKAEIARTKSRAIARDKQIEEVKKEVTGIGKSLDRHIEDHREKDGKVWGHIENIDNRLQTIEKNLILKTEFDELQNNVHRIDKTVVEIHTILKERDRHNGRGEE